MARILKTRCSFYSEEDQQELDWSNKHILFYLTVNGQTLIILGHHWLIFLRLRILARPQSFGLHHFG